MSKVRILNIREFDGNEKLVDFYCKDLPTHLQEHSRNITAPHKHDFFLTVLFTRGSGIHEVDFEKHNVASGSVFMLNPGQTHHWELSDDIDGIIFFHSQEFFEVSFTDHSIYDFPFFQSIRHSSELRLSTIEQKEMAESFGSVLKEYRNRDTWSRKKIVSLLAGIYIDLSRSYLNNADDMHVKMGMQSGYVRDLEKFIEQNFKTEKSPSVYADMLHITIRHLNRLTQEALGKSTTQLITERVILEAKRLLVYDSSSLAEISFSLGYEDYAYFSRLFKKWTSWTPSEFGKLYKSESGKNRY